MFLPFEKGRNIDAQARPDNLHTCHLYSKEVAKEMLD